MNLPRSPLHMPREARTQAPALPSLLEAKTSTVTLGSRWGLALSSANIPVQQTVAGSLQNQTALTRVIRALGEFQKEVLCQSE